MPKENKPRGRREKRKRQEIEEEVPSKRPRSAEPEAPEFIGLEIPTTIREDVVDPEESTFNGVERPFYGMLDEEEQEYFRRADEMLELNDFPSDEERSLFLANVYREAEGKELKIANSQSCSRLMERLILLSTSEQKKKLFEKFSGNFPHLIQHRFASHCCETLFIQSAPVVTEELTSDDVDQQPVADGNEDAVYVSMENLFLYTLNELEGQLNFLLTDRFASHTLRVLLIVLSGLPLSKVSTKSLLQSKRKEKIGITGFNANSSELSSSIRTVPESFQFAISKIISDTVAGLDTAFIRVLATHPTGNPTLQLLLELELTQQGKGKAAAATNSIISKLLPDDMTVEGSESATFINGIIYEPIGSRLLETIVTFAPGKLFKQIYRTIFKERMGSLARNEIASFVVIKVLERLSKDDLEEAVTLIIPQLSNLIERHRTTVIKTLFDRCQARKTWASIKALTAAVAEGYGSDPSTLLFKMTQFTQPIVTDDETTSKPEPRSAPEALHGSLLAQTMLSIPEAPTSLIQNALMSLSHGTILAFSLATTTSHILQAALIPSSSNLSFRRKLINTLITPESGSEDAQDTVLTLALSKVGSHTLDALFTGTTGLMSLKERIALALLSHESTLRDDFCGRVVWRNWMLDLFKRRRAEWIGKVKDGEGGAGTGVATIGAAKLEDATGEEKKVASAGGNGKIPFKGKAGANGSGKTALELAREKFAAAKLNGGVTAAPQKRQGFRPTGANANVIQGTR